jgi:uracil-DNA glycosylase
MSRPPVDPDELARLLRQRSELGLGGLTFESLTRNRVLELARSARKAEGTGAPRLQAAEAPDAVPAAPPSRLAEREAGSPGPAASSSEREDSGDFEPPMDYDELREAALACTRCRLSQGRTQVVFSDGNPKGRVMVVGEAPGANEDRTGLPFVGAAGKLLDLLLASVGLSRQESVYICNVLKCRPPGNRNPRPDEIERCAPWLLRQIQLVRPEVILAVGTFAGQLLAGRDMALGRLRGQVYSYQGTPLIVTYHPAALLRNSGWTRATWDDFQLLRQVLDGS